jgi:hypothetical protein
MSATVFLVINGVIVAYLLARIFSSKNPRPTDLKMDLNRDLAAETITTSQEFSSSSNESGENPLEKNLNCYFQFNGHLFDAFDVLGVPAGSNKESCERALQDLKRRSSSDLQFLQFCSEALNKYFA